MVASIPAAVAISRHVRNEYGVAEYGDRQNPIAVVFLHGWGASKRLWEPIQCALADTVYSIAIDRPGTGGSAWHQDCSSMSGMVAWFRTALDHIAAAPLFVVGHSLGGHLAALFAGQFPAAVRGLILVDTPESGAVLPKRSQWPLGDHGPWMLNLTQAATAAQLKMCRKFGDASTTVRADMYLIDNTAIGLHRQLRALHASRIDTESIRNSGFPRMVLSGDHDRMVALEHAVNLATGLDPCALYVFSQCGHCPMDDKPQEFTAIIRDFCIRN